MGPLGEAAYGSLVVVPPPQAVFQHQECPPHQAPAQDCLHFGVAAALAQAVALAGLDAVLAEVVEVADVLAEVGVVPVED